MTINQSQSVQSKNNVISLRERQGAHGEESMPVGASHSSLTVPRRSPKEEVEVVRKVGLQKPVLPYTRGNYPREYRNHDNMKQRCRKGNGVLDPRFKKFVDFIHHMGPRPGGSYSIDRIDHTNPDYSPENCQWASKSQQSRNRSITRMLSDNNGLRLPVAEWTTKAGLSANTILKRIERGWSEHDAIHRPKGCRLKNPQLKKSESAQLPSANCDELAALCEQKLREVHKQEFICIRPKHRKMLKDISRLLEAGGIPSLPALTLAYEEWSEFCIYADKNYGAFKPPAIPTIEYLTRAISALGNFYLLHLQRRKGQITRQQQQALLEEQRNCAQQKTEQRRQFISNYLHSDSVYKQLADRLIWLKSVEDKPNYGMELKHYIEYAPIHFFLHGGYGDEAMEHEPPEHWAERAIKDTTQNFPRIIWKQLMADTKDALETLLQEEGLQKEAEDAYTKSQQPTIKHT